MTDDRLYATYRVHAADEAEAQRRVRWLALEQTVELPEGSYPERIEREVVARVDALEPVAEGVWEVRLCYPLGLVLGDVPQLFNVLFGNVSLEPAIALVDLRLPDAVLQWLGGPRFGIEGIRAACSQAEGRALVVSAAKPVGLSSVELAERCGALARGGVDIVKDDHGVTDQPWAPFRERVARCAEAVQQANALTGGTTLYAPNVTAPATDLGDRLAAARDVGCRAVLLSPFLMGLDSVRRVALEERLIVMTHPTFAGSLLHASGGIAPDVLLGHLLRVLGADAVIYLNPGGRFDVGDDTGERINARLREPLRGVRTALPIAGGGVDARRVPSWIDRYGTDVAFLVGGSLYAAGDLEEAARELVEAVRRHCHG